MPKFLVSAIYSAEGWKGVKKDKASRREKAVTAACTGLGGKLEAFYYALGKDDLFAIVDMPSTVSMASFGAAIGASGMVRTHTVPLLTVAEMDQALGEDAKYKPPGT